MQGTIPIVSTAVDSRGCGSDRIQATGNKGEETDGQANGHRQLARKAL
jgi:hypothetical protein